MASFIYGKTGAIVIMEKTNKGRINAFIIDKEIYVFELKFNSDKDRALNQIKGKKYFENYHGEGKKIYLFGVEFINRNVGEWVFEKTFKFPFQALDLDLCTFVRVLSRVFYHMELRPLKNANFCSS